MNKDIILKTSLVISIILMIILGSYAADTMKPAFVISALACGLYACVFSIINQGKWIFKWEDNDYEN